MNPKLHARSLEYSSSFEGGMEDPDATQQMLLKALAINDKHNGEQSLEVALTLNNLSNACMSLGDFRTQKEFLQRALKIKENHYLQTSLGKFVYDPLDIGVTVDELGQRVQSARGQTARPKKSSSTPSR